ncbi:hypothetical protein [Oceanobacter sp. 4_MG-2023]|uniref:hypothetical protein n=1 Tax=Oceanobacter sp. 4_MG-2023 TaxID=3062623 RepID=UPI00273321A1|nr:hypothetical protein [Oceanobacter sp. 4_MG-2023]MDP2548715.1 hypothetical protein [Oceanobacter sp. 4_MG-2023]
MKKLIFSAAVIAASCYTYSAMAACPATGNATLNSAITDIGLKSWIGGATYQVCQLPTSITINAAATLQNDVTVGVGPGAVTYPVLWTLPGIVTVGDGYAQNTAYASADHTELTIEEGVHVVASASNAALVIARGAKLNAQGTVNDPIVFSYLDDDDFSGDDEDYSGEGQWGGVILSGYGVANECTSGDTCTMEGISTGYYFGSGSTSKAAGETGSGTLTYVVITEGGTQIDVEDPDPVANGGDEINGLTLYAVTSATTINHIHVNENLDDGIEFFGGDVAVSDIWLTCNGDDSVDWDYGFHGSIENVYIEQGDKNGAEDYAFELAGNPNNSAATPLASATVTGVWVQYNGSNAATMTDAIFKLKEGTGNTNGTANGVVGGTPLFDEIVITGYAGQECAEISSANISTDSFEAVSYDCAITAAADGKFVPTGSSSFTYNNSFWTAPACL